MIEVWLHIFLLQVLYDSQKLTSNIIIFEVVDLTRPNSIHFFFQWKLVNFQYFMNIMTMTKPKLQSKLTEIMVVFYFLCNFLCHNLIAYWDSHIYGFHKEHYLRRLSKMKNFLFSRKRSNIFITKHRNIHCICAHIISHPK